MNTETKTIEVDLKEINKEADAKRYSTDLFKDWIVEMETRGWIVSTPLFHVSDNPEDPWKAFITCEVEVIKP